MLSEAPGIYVASPGALLSLLAPTQGTCGLLRGRRCCGVFRKEVAGRAGRQAAEAREAAEAI